MKRLTLLLLLLTTPAFADVDNPTQWTEVDGSPSVYNPWKISVSNGTLTNNGDGSISVTTGGGGSGSGVPGGSGTEIQYRAGATTFGAAANSAYTTTTETVSTGTLTIGGTTLANSDITLNSNGAAVFNEQSNAVDFRIESDGNANLFFVDGTNNKAIFGSNTTNGSGPLNVTASDSTMSLQATSVSAWSGFNVYDNSNSLVASFQYGNASASAFADQLIFAARSNTTPIIFYTVGAGGISDYKEHFRLSAGGVSTVFNEIGDNMDFRVESDTDANALLVEGTDGTVMVGVSGALAGAKFSVQSAGTSNFTNIATFLAPGVTTSGDKTCFNVGVANSSNDLNSFCFKNVGSGSTSNAFEVYFHSQPTPVASFEQNGKVVFANTTQIASTGSLSAPSATFASTTQISTTGTVSAPGFAFQQTTTAGQLLRSNGTNQTASFTTATYPLTASASGAIMRANGTNWLATSATYPNTITSGRVLVATGSDAIGASGADFTYSSTTQNVSATSVSLSGVYFTPTTVASLGGPTLGRVRFISDGLTFADCTVGGGSNAHVCMADGTAWKNS